MRLVDILSQELIIPDLAAQSRDAVVAELVECIVRAAPHMDRSYATRVLLERERIGSTGVGNGLAIPHAKLRISAAVACFGRSSGGVQFGALDGKPTHLFFTLLCPEGNPGFHLQALARASRLFRDANFRARLMRGENAQEIWAAIAQQDQALTAQGPS